MKIFRIENFQVNPYTIIICVLAWSLSSVWLFGVKLLNLNFTVMKCPRRFTIMCNEVYFHTGLNINSDTLLLMTNGYQTAWDKLLID